MWQKDIFPKFKFRTTTGTVNSQFSSLSCHVTNLYTHTYNIFVKVNFMSICDVVRFLIASVFFFENYSLFMYNVSNTKGDIERLELHWLDIVYEKLKR